LKIKLISLSLLFLLVISSVVLNPVSISSSYWNVYANSNNSTTPSTDSVVPATNVTSQGTISNLSLQNPVINSTIASIDKNIKSSMDQPKPVTVPTNYTISSNATSIKIPINSTSVLATNDTNHANTTSLVSANTTSLSDIIRITDVMSSFLNSTIHANSTNQIQIPNATKSWQFNSSTNSSAVGNIKIEKNVTSLNLIGQGYLQENVNATRNLANLTLSAWIKPDYSQGSSQFTVISKENEFVLAINNNIPPPKKAIFSVFDGIKWSTINSTTIIPEQWTHLAATFNRTSIEIYVNGKLESSLAITGIPTLSVRGGLTTKTVDTISSNADIIIGAYLNTLRSTPSNLFSGSIQDVKLYDSLLSPSQIANLYENNIHAHLSINTIPINSLSDNIKITDGVTAHLNSIPTNATLYAPINSTVSDNIKIIDGIAVYINSTTPDYTIPINATSLSDNIKITDTITVLLNSTTLTAQPTINPELKTTKESYLITENPQLNFQYLNDSYILKKAQKEINSNLVQINKVEEHLNKTEADLNKTSEKVSVKTDQMIQKAQQQINEAQQQINVTQQQIQQALAQPSSQTKVKDAIAQTLDAQQQVQQAKQQVQLTADQLINTGKDLKKSGDEIKQIATQISENNQTTQYGQWKGNNETITVQVQGPDGKPLDIQPQVEQILEGK